jgi:hypothetical protein
MSLVSKALIDAYLRTEFWVEPPQRERFCLTIGKPSRAADMLLAQYGAHSAVYLTAWNPRSVPTAPAINVAAQASLQHEIQMVSVAQFPGIGLDPSGDWPGEASIFALGIDRQDAERIATHYEQNAIVWFNPTTPPKLVLLR